MPSYTVLNVKLQRDSASIPWGFRMIGGKDFGSPLQIQRVNPGSVAEKYGIKPNDYIVKILSTSTEHLKHQDAQDCIIRQQNNLELTVQRETVPDQNDYSSNSEFPPHELISPSQPKPNYQQQESQKPILEPELPVTNNQTLLTQVHNTPIGLYSADTVTNTLNQTLKNDDLHDSDYSSPSNLSTSSSYQSLARSTSNNSITNTVPNRGVNNIIKRLNNHPSNGTKSVEDLQSKYLSCEDKLKNETRQGPSFRALLKGLDNGTISTAIQNDSITSQPPSHQEQNKTLSTASKDVRPTQSVRNDSNMNNKFQNLNMSSDHKVEEPTSFNERKASATKASPKPTSMANNGPVQSLFSSNSSQTSLSSPDKSTTRQTPGLMNQHQPHATPTPSFNVNTTPTNKTSRTLMKGAKGSALLNKESSSGSQIPICYSCGIVIRGPFITAIGRTWCVDHFRCSKCTINLTECGFVEEKGKLYCELDFEKYLAPKCHKCHQAILKECCHALDKSWHPDCFVCTNCKKSISTGSFHVENGQPYCLEDFRRMFQSKCSNCDFAIEPGDPYVEVESLNGTYHVECFNCSICQTSLEGQLFIVKNNRPFCRKHGY